MFSLLTFHLLFVFQNSKSAQGLVGLRNLGNTVSVFNGMISCSYRWSVYLYSVVFFVHFWHKFVPKLDYLFSISGRCDDAACDTSPLECDICNSHVHTYQANQLKIIQHISNEVLKVFAVEQWRHSHIYTDHIQHIQHAKNRSKLSNLTISG